jgi:iron complex outermembrane recepter protein
MPFVTPGRRSSRSASGSPGRKRRLGPHWIERAAMHTPSLIVLSLFIAAPAAAQPAPAPSPSTDVVGASDDAFGRRIGVEEVGLYSESEVRGFNLQSAGNYRIDGHYFVRNGSPANVTIDGTAIRVGINGLRTDFATPSGVVVYDLVSAAPGAAGSIEAGWWGGSGPVLALRVNAAAPDGRLGIAGGVQLNPWQRYVDGSSGDYYAAGAVARWRPSAGVSLGAIASQTWFRPQADTLFSFEGAVPRRVRRNLYRGQSWMVSETNATVAGLVADVDRAGWNLGASTFLSQSDDPKTFFNLITVPAGGGAADYLVVDTPAQRFRSISSEIFAARSFVTGGISHRLIAMARRRDTGARTSAGVAASLGTMPDLDAPPVFARPDFRFDSRRLRDEVDQSSLGFGYRGSVGEQFELRADVQKARYVRRVTDLDGGVEQRASEPWLYSGAIAAGLSARLTLFASHARGLEESGVAPGNAVNRGELLPATLARQSEIGLRYIVEEGPSLIAGLFDIAKPLPGLRTDGVYDFVGEVRHRGVELSLAGPLTERLSAVLGATFLEARLSGDLVDRGLIGSEPVGRPERAMLASLTWRVPGLRGLTIDGGVSMRGAREANRENSFSLPSYATFNFGVRQPFRLNGQAFNLRARVTNIFNGFNWNVASSGLYFFTGSRVFTLTLTGDL